MSLPNHQPRGVGIIGLISPLWQLLTLRGFRHRQCSYHPGHWDLLLKGLQVSRLVPYYHDCLFTAFPQLGVCILYSKALQQGTILSSYGLYHDINAFSHIGPPCLHWHNSGREGLYGLCILGVHQLVITVHINFFLLAITHFQGHHPAY